MFRRLDDDKFLTGRRAVKALVRRWLVGIAGVAVYAQLKGPSSSQTAYRPADRAGREDDGRADDGRLDRRLPDGRHPRRPRRVRQRRRHVHAADEPRAAATPPASMRAHGSNGAFVSKWVIDKNTLHVVSGGDLMQQVFLWNAGDAAVERRVRRTVRVQPLLLGRSAGGHGVLQRRDRPRHAASASTCTAKKAAPPAISWRTVVTGPDAGKSYVLGKFNLTHQRLRA